MPDWLRRLGRRKRTFAVLQPVAIDEMTYGTFSATWLESHRVDPELIRSHQIVGIGHVQREIDSLLSRLRNPDLVREAGAQPPRGVLFWGDPGTGKTLTARHVANQLGADVPFYELSSDELSPERARTILRYLADTHQRSVLYIDEIDGFALNRDASQHTATTRAVLVAFLAALDGIVESEGPIVIASSNRAPFFLDAALTRPGRLGFSVAFDTPNEEERVDLFELFARGRVLEGEVDWRRMAELSRGQSPAGLRQALDDALGIALTDGRSVVRESDIVEALRRRGQVIPDIRLDDDELRHLCVHEAGHVAVAVALAGPEWVYAVDVSERGGVTHVGRDEDQHVTLPDREIRARIVSAFGGLVAERVVVGEMHRPSDADVDRVTRWLISRVENGLDEHFPPLSPASFGDELPETLRTRLAELVEQHAVEAQDVATNVVETHAEGVRRFAERLLVERTLSGQKLREAIAEAQFALMPELAESWLG